MNYVFNLRNCLGSSSLNKPQSFIGNFKTVTNKNKLSLCDRIHQLVND